MLESAKWQTVSWRRGTKGKLSARFAAMRVRVADGPPQRIGDLGQQHLPGHCAVSRLQEVARLDPGEAAGQHAAAELWA